MGFKSKQDNLGCIKNEMKLPLFVHKELFLNTINFANLISNNVWSNICMYYEI